MIARETSSSTTCRPPLLVTRTSSITDRVPPKRNGRTTPRMPQRPRPSPAGPPGAASDVPAGTSARVVPPYAVRRDDHPPGDHRGQRPVRPRAASGTGSGAVRQLGGRLARGSRRVPAGEPVVPRRPCRWTAGRVRHAELERRASAARDQRPVVPLEAAHRPPAPGQGLRPGGRATDRGACARRGRYRAAHQLRPRRGRAGRLLRPARIRPDRRTRPRGGDPPAAGPAGVTRPRPVTVDVLVVGVLVVDQRGQAAGVPAGTSTRWITRTYRPPRPVGGRRRGCP